MTNQTDKAAALREAIYKAAESIHFDEHEEDVKSVEESMDACTRLIHAKADQILHLVQDAVLEVLPETLMYSDEPLLYIDGHNKCLETAKTNIQRLFGGDV